MKRIARMKTAGLPSGLMMRIVSWSVLATGLVLGSLAAAPAHARSVADFYRGKTVNVLIGVGVGGEYDLQARLVARHLGKHIPGNPGVVPQNMTGAGGIKMANYLFAQAPRDGTAIGMLGNNFAATQAVGGQGVQFDVVKCQASFGVNACRCGGRVLSAAHECGHRQYPQLCHHRPYRPRQIDARRPVDPGDRRRRRA